MKQKEKRIYETPEVTIMEVEVEKGFATSNLDDVTGENVFGPDPDF